MNNDVTQISPDKFTKLTKSQSLVAFACVSKLSKLATLSPPRLNRVKKNSAKCQSLEAIWYDKLIVTEFDTFIVAMLSQAYFSKLSIFQFSL